MFKHTAKPVRNTLDDQPHAAHLLDEQRFGSYEDVKKWLDEWFVAKGRGVHKLPEKMGKMYNERCSIF